MSFETYQDSGRLISSNAAGREIMNIEFSTVFRRPDRYMFKWVDLENGETVGRDSIWNAVGMDENGPYCFRGHVGKREVAQDFEHAIAGATGVSGGAAQTIANLLCTQVGGLQVSQLIRLKLGQELLHGEPCHRITGYSPWDSSTTYQVYIEAQSGLLRQMVELDIDGGASHEFRRDIRFNVELPDETFRFHQTARAK